MGDFLSPSDATEKISNNLTAVKKEELSKASNEKKWIVARSMFALCFGVAWLAIFVKVVLVIIEVSKCIPEPKLKWYQDNVIYKVNMQEFAGDFNGLKEQLHYIDDMKAETILIVGMNDEADPTQVIYSQERDFKSLVNKIHEKRGRKIIVDAAVYSLSVENEKFLESASAACERNPDIDFCDMFVWKALDVQANNDSEEGWYFDSNRNQSFKTVEGNPDQAILNYGSTETLPYILKVLDAWLARGVDGIQVRDMSRLHNITQNEFTAAVWKNQFFSNQKRSTVALYVSSSIPQANPTPVSLLNNQSNCVHSPVFVTTDIGDFVGKEGAGNMIKRFINKWRTESRFINGYQLGSIDEPLAASRFPDYAAGLVLLSLALPGVAVLRSGDEVLATSGTYARNADSLNRLAINGNKEFLEELKRLITFRVAGFRSKESLRFDTKGNDTEFTFLELDNPDILAYKRQWSTRDPIMVVSNMSPNNHTVSLIVRGSFMEDNNYVNQAKILASSLPSRYGKDDVILLDSLELNSGVTLVMEAN